MTPNPKNIGAAPEEYPIRALLRVGADNGIPAYLEGTVFQARRTGSGIYGLLDVDSPSSPWVALEKSVIIDPTPEQIAEERAKLSPDAAGVPEPQAKGPSPSEVPQPGEGVDLEAIEARLKEAGGGPWKGDATWVMLSTLKAILADGPALIAEIRSLRSALEGLYNKGWTKEAIEAARVALRRESK